MALNATIAPRTAAEDCPWVASGISVREREPPQFCNLFHGDEDSCVVAYCRAHASVVPALIARLEDT